MTYGSEWDTHSMELQPYQQQWHQPPVPWKPPGSGLAVASMVLGITSLVFCWWGLATLAMWVLAVTFGGVSIHRATEAGQPKNGMAVAGLVLGVLGGLAYMILGVVTLGAMFII